ncbi:MAG: S46 family peptidase, partial [Bacteroidota bacterium]|nr:S46 family peptidase [Bacteroidota bacterium]
MRKIIFILSLMVSLFLTNMAKADGGMWLPMLLSMNESDMQAKGMQISTKDIYDVNNASLKDAVMLFGGGCTGEFVSNQGLVFTNHHCGYSYIVKHSTVEHDYLTNGFVANSLQEELPCPGLSVTILQYMKDVTAEVLQGVDNKLTSEQRKTLIKTNIDNLIAKETQGTDYSAIIKPIYYGNQYIMWVNRVYNDVRLVAAPPSNIGKFGGDTDNWMWPRHTGDFSVFRVYASKDNKPAKYHKDNVPYTPKKFLKISLKEKNEGDFTFVFGYPGTTKQFLTSFAVEQVQNYEDPIRIKLRTEVLNVYNQAMNESPAKRLRYASNVAGIANGWKKWQGEVKGLKFLNAIEKKQEFEKNYTDIIPQFKQTYSNNLPYKLKEIYLSEAVLSSQMMKQARQMLNLITLSLSDTASEGTTNLYAKKLLDNLQTYYSNDFASQRVVDSTIFVRTMLIFYNDFAKDNYSFLKERINKKYKGEAEKYFAEVFSHTILTNPKQVEKLLTSYKKKNYKKLSEDCAVELLSPIWKEYFDKDIDNLAKNENTLDSLYRIYVAQIMEKEKDRMFYPDANLTLRVAYGNIASFHPRDAITYKHYTTLQGIMEKENPDIYDYVVEKKLKDLYLNKDYGQYANSLGEMPVAFIASNHTTGGNSGSPVMDKDGNLIGINFDRNWEGTMSDILYDKDLCRNISLDIRYCLFIIDKFLGAENIIKELE